MFVLTLVFVLARPFLLNFFKVVRLMAHRGVVDSVRHFSVALMLHLDQSPENFILTLPAITTRLFTMLPEFYLLSHFLHLINAFSDCCPQINCTMGRQSVDGEASRSISLVSFV